jgi:hypothetical protein
MLVTLEQFAEVPAKIHLFYEYAFEALFGRHDVTKGGFQRKRHTALALDDFKRLFSYFCMFTYMRDMYAFSSDKVLEVLQQSIDASQIEVDKVLFRNDLTESTCMLVVDGLDLTFSHRSFQEYFSAYFLSRVKVDEFGRALPQLIKKSTFDNVLKMVSEMNKEKFEETWTLPALNRLCESVKDINAKTDVVKFTLALLKKTNAYLDIAMVFDSRSSDDHMRFIFDFKPDEKMKSKSVSQSMLRLAVYRTYGLFEIIGSEMRAVPLRDEQLFKEIEDGKLLKGDPRAEIIMEEWARVKEKGPIMSKRIEVTNEDSKWMIGSYMSVFCDIESRVLERFRDDVRRRVDERRRGLSLFFPTSG